MHLVVNSASLSNLGPLLENNVGHARFVAVYLLAGFAGNVASFFGSTNPSLGASGAAGAWAACVHVPACVNAYKCQV